MGMAFLLEPWWPLGDERWGVFAAVCLLVVILTYFLPDELKWVTRIQEDSRWKLLWLKLYPRHSETRAKKEFDVGWYDCGDEDEEVDPGIEERYERQLRRGLGLPPRVRDGD